MGFKGLRIVGVDSRPSQPGADPAIVREHVAKIIASSAFVRAPRMQRFLEFLVKETLAGRSGQLKEYTIAVAVFDKPVDFDPGTSAVIRVEAGRLRRMLAGYYAEAAGSDAITLEIPKGSYVPLFRERAGQAEEEVLPSTPAPTGWRPSQEQRLATVLSCALGSRSGHSGCGLESDFLGSFDVFHRLSSAIAAQHGGTVDGSASDRLIVYFGWPQVLEDAAGRALTAALEMLSAFRETIGGEDPGIRIGIATSEVVIRSPAAADETCPRVIGSAPLIATAMLQQAPLNGILVADHSRRLAGDAFEFVPAAQDRDSVLIWRLIGARSSTTRFQAHRCAGEAGGMIGRQEEIALIESRWRLSLSGEGQAVLLVGEAGIGKSLLAETAIARAGDQAATLRMQCSPHHANSALLPVSEMLRSLAPEMAFDGDEADRFLRSYGLDSAQDRALFGSLVSGPELDAVSFPSASRHKDETLKLLVRWLAAQAQRQPTILLVEDLHWADPTTVELLQEAIALAARHNLMILLTSRVDAPAELARRTNLMSLRLARLPKDDCDALITRMASAVSLPPATRTAILERAEGIPLFIEELTRLLLGTDVFRPSDCRIPASLSDLLASQLGRLGAARGIAQVASVIGREFSREMLRAAAGASDEELDAALDRLLAAGLVLRAQPLEQHYLFRHALLRDAAYASILEPDRRLLHSRIASHLIDTSPDVAASHPELVAGHLMEAGEFAEAFPFWVDAGAKAASRHALAEAIADYQQARAALENLPPTDQRRERELDVLIRLGQAMRTAHGYGNAELLPIYERARALAAELNNGFQLANAIYGLWTHAAGCGRWSSAVAIANDFDRLTQDWNDPQIRAEAYRLLGASAAFRGDFPLAVHHFERAMDVYDVRRNGPGYGFDPGAASAAYLAWITWHMGDAETSRRYAEQALAVADAKGHPATLAMVLSWLMFRAVCEHDLAAIDAYNGRLQSVCEERDCRYWQPFGEACAEWAAFQADGDLRRLDRLVTFTWDFRERYFTSCLLLLATEICLQRGLVDKGLELAREAGQFMEQHDERVWEAEWHRLTAELLLRKSSDNLPQARQLLRRAAALAHRQGASVLEGRSATRLNSLEDGPAREAPGEVIGASRRV